MTPAEFEALRRRLEEQLRADVELLYEAHRVKLRAFETVLLAQADAGPGYKVSATVVNEVARPSMAASPEPSRRKAWSVFDAVEEALEQVPELFDKTDLEQVIGQKPSRATLARTLQMLVRDGRIRVEQGGVGRYPTLYRKLSEDATAPAGATPAGS
jgi:hypothetical protein